MLMSFIQTSSVCFVILLLLLLLLFIIIIIFIFFFQAEDGIRDVAVTGVQTCALPIYSTEDGTFNSDNEYLTIINTARVKRLDLLEYYDSRKNILEIGRASCRERV